MHLQRRLNMLAGTVYHVGAFNAEWHFDCGCLIHFDLLLTTQETLISSGII